MVVAEDRSISATSRYFEERLVRATRRNRQLVHDLTSELEKEGVNTLHDLSEMPQGYKTKMLHVITHLLDGFFGIDTFFYNLEEDSHWVSEKMRGQMLATPSLFWILSIEADI